MPIRPPALDDRSFHDLVEEVLARIPAHTPEYTHPRPGDPGRTLIELFAWLTDTLLYRANLIPEKQRLTFLRLLGQPLRGATPARGLVGLQLDEESADAITLRRLATLRGPAPFETLDEVTVLPITAEAYYKRPLTPAELDSLGADVLDALPQVYGLGDDTGGGVTPRFYATTPVFAGGAAMAGGFDLVGETVDASLWLALLAPTEALVPAVRTTLRGDGEQRILSVGVMPSIEVPALFEELAQRARIPHVWEIATGRVAPGRAGGEPEYIVLDPVRDTSVGLTRRGVLRLLLPATDAGAFENDVRTDVDAGLGDRPPRIDDAAIRHRVVTWLRLRPAGTQKLEKLRLSWVGVNAVEIDQRQTVVGRIVGTSSGNADLELQLPGTSIDPGSLALEVEETQRGFAPWTQIDDLALAGPDDAVYSLDPEAGTIRFGDGMRGRVPDAGARVRVAAMRAGGGFAGNLPPGSLKEISAVDLAGQRVNRRLKVVQSLATDGGTDPENLAEAERRIPGLLRHRDRAVTADDFKRLAAETPGALLGRVEVLPRFKPQQRRSDVPGVTSVMVLPFKPGFSSPNPRADRPLLEAVHGWLDERRPLAMELYTIGCEYVPLAVSAGVSLRDGVPRDETLLAVKDALRRYLWPLFPGGQDGGGWTLGRAVRDRELEVVVAQVPGISEVHGVNLFERRGAGWLLVDRRNATGAIEIPLAPWQLPELLGVLVVADASAPTDPTRIPNPFADDAAAGVAIPTVPERC